MKGKDIEIDKELHKVMNDWHERAVLCQSAHYDAGNFYEKLFLMLGCTVVALSAAIGSAEVLVPAVKIEQIGGDYAKAISGVISLFVAILAGLQTFLKFSQKAERHRLAGAKYGDIRRSIEELGVLSAESITDAKTELHDIKKRMDSLALESPELPDKVVNRHGGADARGTWKAKAMNLTRPTLQAGFEHLGAVCCRIRTARMQQTPYAGRGSSH